MCSKAQRKLQSKEGAYLAAEQFHVIRRFFVITGGIYFVVLFEVLVPIKEALHNEPGVFVRIPVEKKRNPFGIGWNLGRRFVVVVM